MIPLSNLHLIRPLLSDSTPDDDDFDIDDEEITTLLKINDAFTFISLLAGLTVLFLFIKTWKTCSQVGKMGFFLTLANLIYTITNLLPVLYRGLFSYCPLDGTLRTFSILSCIVWATKIATTAFKALIRRDYNPNTPVGAIWGFAIPFIVALIPLIPNGGYLYYDNLGLNCDVYSDVESLRPVWIILMNIIPLIVSIVLTAFSYARIIKYLRNLQGDYEIPTRRFIAYPLSLMISWLPLLVFRVAYFIDYNIWLDGAAIVFSRSSGIINAVLYGWERFKVAQNINNIGEEKENEVEFGRDRTESTESYADLSYLDEDLDNIDDMQRRKSTNYKL